MILCLKELQIKMSLQLFHKVPTGAIKRRFDEQNQPLFKRADLGKYVDIENIKLNFKDFPSHYTRLKSGLKGGGLTPSLGRTKNPHDIFINLDGSIEMIVRSKNPKAVALVKWLTKNVIEKIQEVHHQAIDEEDAATALLNDDLKNREYENVGLQGEIRAKNQQIAAWQRRYVGYLSDEDKNNGISIIAKNNDEAEYPYISICGQHGYRRHKARVLLTRNKGSTLFADGDTAYAIVTYNFWQEHRLIVVDPNRPRHFRLDTINQEQLLALNDT